jgi:hypothetical protein
MLFSITGPYILRIIFLSNILNMFSSVVVRVHVSAPYVTIGLINVLYTCKNKSHIVTIWFHGSVLNYCICHEDLETDHTHSKKETA